MRTRFNLLLIAPDPIREAFAGIFREVIETIEWGLIELGHDTTRSINEIARDRKNIVFGPQMLTENQFEALPQDSIIYNLEQLRGYSPTELKPIFKGFAERFEIWDFSEANLGVWKLFNPVGPVKVARIGYAPILERIPKVEQDIDVLFYGGLSNERIQVLESLGLVGVVFASNIFGGVRDSLVARSKLVLNINRITSSQILEIVRVSYLLANGIAVVADRQSGTYVEDDLEDALAFSELSEFAKTCQALLGDNVRRKELGKRGQAAFRNRDIRKILFEALK